MKKVGEKAEEQGKDAACEEAGAPICRSGCSSRSLGDVAVHLLRGAVGLVPQDERHRQAHADFGHARGIAECLHSNAEEVWSSELARRRRASTSRGVATPPMPVIACVWRGYRVNDSDGRGRARRRVPRRPDHVGASYTQEPSCVFFPESIFTWGAGSCCCSCCCCCAMAAKYGGKLITYSMTVASPQRLQSGTRILQGSRAAHALRMVDLAPRTP